MDDRAIWCCAHFYFCEGIPNNAFSENDVGLYRSCDSVTVAARGAGITQGGACGVFAACSTRQALHATDVLLPAGLCGLGAGFFQGFLLALGFLRLALLVVSQLLLLVQFFQAFFFALGFLLLGLFLLQAFLSLLLQPSLRKCLSKPPRSRYSANAACAGTDALSVQVSLCRATVRVKRPGVAQPMR